MSIERIGSPTIKMNNIEASSGIADRAVINKGTVRESGVKDVFNHIVKTICRGASVVVSPCKRLVTENQREDQFQKMMRDIQWG